MVCGDERTADHNSNVHATEPYLYKVPTTWLDPETLTIDTLNGSYVGWFWHCGDPNSSGASKLAAGLASMIIFS